MTSPLEDSHLPRKFFHMVWASIIPTIYYFEFLPRPMVVGATVAITLVWLVFEIIRLKTPVVNKFFQHHFAPLMKRKEAKSLTGVTYMLIGTSVCLVAFRPEVAAVALFFIALGDPTAAIVGKSFGGPVVVNGKTLSGSGAMFVTCLGVGSVLLNFGFIVFFGAIVATVTELFAGKLDDNLVTPVASGATMTLLGTF